MQWSSISKWAVLLISWHHRRPFCVVLIFSTGCALQCAGAAAISFLSLPFQARFYRGLSWKTVYISLWVLMTPAHFMYSLIISWLKLFGEEKRWLLPRLWLKLQSVIPQKWLGLYAAVGSSAHGIAFAFNESLAWRSREDSWCLLSACTWDRCLALSGKDLQAGYIWKAGD